MTRGNGLLTCMPNVTVEKILSPWQRALTDI
jgi:hypothetical protein